MTEIITYQNYLTTYSRRLRKRMTRAEQVLWHHIRRRQVNNVQFVRQRPIGNYIVDFYSKDYKLVIEVDGGVHYSPEARQKDFIREQVIKSFGIRVLRFTNEQVLFDMGKVLSALRTVLCDVK